MKQNQVLGVIKVGLLNFQYRKQHKNKEETNHVKKQSAIVATFNTPTEAEYAVKQVQKAGFDMKKLSIVGKEYHSDEHVVGYYNLGDRANNWGKLGAFWAGLWGMLFGSAFFLIPGIGPILVAGPLVAWIVGALEGVVVVGGLSALDAAL